MKDQTQVRIYTEPTYFMLMSAKNIVMRDAEKYGFQDASDVTWDFIINYALKQAFGKDKDAGNAINE